MNRTFKNVMPRILLVLPVMLLLFSLSPLANAQVCSSPSNLTSQVSAGGVVSLSWSAAQGAPTYIVQYRLSGTTAWVSGGTVTTTNQIISNLLPERVYQWRVRASCSVFSSVAVFTSGGGVGGNTACSQPSNLIANVLSTTSANLEWASVEGALYYTVQYRRLNTPTWLTAGSVTSLSLSLSGLLENVEYQWRVKASCSVYSSISTFQTGVLGGNTTCSQPSNLEAVSVTGNSATLSWSAVQEATTYTVQYRIGLIGAWTLAGTVSGNSLSLTGLQAGSEYSWQVKANCSDFAGPAVFSTSGASGGSGVVTPPSSCSPPSNTNVLTVTSTSASVEWEPIAGVTTYTVQYKLELGGSYITLGNFSTSAASIGGLLPATKYVWRVKASCSAYGSDVQFETLPAFARVAATGNVLATSNAVKAFPNPVRTGVIQIELANDAGISIFNQTGQLLFTNLSLQKLHVVDVSTFNNGVYLVQVHTQKGSKTTTRFIVAR